MKDKNKLKTSVKSMMIAIGVLDRVQGTEIYKLEKDFYGWSDSDYDQMLEHLGTLYQTLSSMLPPDEEPQ